MIRAKNTNSLSHLALVGEDETVCGRKVAYVWVVTVSEAPTCQRCAARIRRHTQLFNLLYGQRQTMAVTLQGQRRGSEPVAVEGPDGQ